ncbi:MAG: hypothetical protein ACLPQS_17720 [Acidimicrobiales bacterium]
MTDFDPPEVPELVAPLLADLDDGQTLSVPPGVTSDDDELILKAAPPARRRRRRYVVAGAVLLLVTAAVAIPLSLEQAQTVSAAVSGVFAQSSVRFAFSASVASQGPGPSGLGSQGLGSYSVVVEITNPTGGPVSAQGSSDAFEVSLLHGTTDLGDVLLADGAFYLRLNTTAIDQLDQSSEPASDSVSGPDLASTLTRAANKRPALAWLHTVVSGGWIGIEESAVEQYAKRLDPHPAAPGINESALRSAFALSFAQAWDAWESTHVVSTTSGVTEYSVSLPVRDFLGTFLADLESQLEKSVPSAEHLVPTLRKAIDEIPASLSIPVQLWIDNGTLIKVAVSYHGTTVSVGISHPNVGLAAPSGATMITIADIRAFAHWFVNDEVKVGDSNSIAVQSNLETGLTGALTSYSSDSLSFADLLNHASSNSLYGLDTGLRFVTDAPSRNARTLSVSVGNAGASMTMTAFAPGTRDCWGVLDLTATETTPVLGIATKPGIYYFENRHVAASACNASTLTKADHPSGTGFSGVSGASGASGVSGVSGVSGSSGFSFGSTTTGSSSSSSP